MWEHGARRRSWRKERKWTQDNCGDKGRTHKEGNMETVTGDETRRERDQNTDMTGETHTEDMADSHRRHRKETEPKKQIQINSTA